MPTFDTPEPISVALELGVGDIRIAASDRTDTVVEIRPSDRNKPGDVTAAEQTRVEYTDGRLLVKAPKRWRQYGWWGESESIDVDIELPAGSRLQGEAGVAALRCTGRVDECRYKTGVGEIHVDQAGPLRVAHGGRRRHRRPRRRPARRSAPARACSRSAASTGRRSSRTRTARPGSARSPATCAPTQRTARSSSIARARPSRPRRRTATSFSVPSRAAGSWPRRRSARSRSGCVDGRRRLARPEHALRHGAERPERVRPPAVRRRRGRDPRPHELRRHHDPPRHRRGRRGEVMTTMNPPPTVPR